MENASHKAQGSGNGGMGATRRVPAVVPVFAPIHGASSTASVGGSSHLALLRDFAEEHSLAAWAVKYLAEEVYGLQSANTLDAKSRDLVGFINWYVDVNGAGDIGHWLPRDTQAYLNHREAQGRAATTINRVFATQRHFARWANDGPHFLHVISASKAGLVRRQGSSCKQ